MPGLSRTALERLLALSVALAVLLTITVVASTGNQQQAAAAWLENARRAAWAPTHLTGRSGGSRRLLQGAQETSLATRWYERVNVHDGSAAAAKATGTRQPVPVPILQHVAMKRPKKPTVRPGSRHAPCQRSDGTAEHTAWLCSSWSERQHKLSAPPSALYRRQGLSVCHVVQSTINSLAQASTEK